MRKPRIIGERVARAQEIIAKLSRAMAPPSTTLPTVEEFEQLLDRFEREFTRAYCTYVWSGTYVEILLLSRRLFVERGDLAEFYARDHAHDLLLARKIEGVEEDPFIRSIEPGDSTVKTLDSIARSYLGRYGRDDIVRNTLFSHLQLVVEAYSPDDTPRLEILDRMIEVLRRNGALPQDDCIFSIRGHAAYQDRAARYARETQRPAPGSGAVAPSERFDDEE